MSPSAQTSVRVSTVFDFAICSGDMYSGDPSVAFVFVNSTLSDAVCFEMPKSNTLTTNEPLRRFDRNKFAGFRSR